jgi:hypothetical protein
VAAVALVREDARDGAADEHLHVRNHGCQRVAAIWIAGQRLHVGDELAAVCTENLNPNVLTMKSAQYGARTPDR